MVKAISGLSGTSKNAFYIGNQSEDGYRYIYASNNLSYSAGLRYNDIDYKWQYTNDGYIWLDIGNGTDLCCPGYIGDDGYVLGVVAGAPDWIPNDRVDSDTLAVGDGISDVVAINLVTSSTSDASINYDGYSDRIYFDSPVSGDNQDFIRTDADLPNSVPFGDSSDTTVSMRMRTDTGDGYLVYNNAAQSLTVSFPSEAGERNVITTDPGDANTAAVGDATQPDVRLRFDTSAGDGYLTYNPSSDRLDIRFPDESNDRTIITTDPGDLNTAAIGDATQSDVRLKLSGSDGDGYLTYDGAADTLTVKFADQSSDAHVLITEPGNINNVILGDNSTPSFSMQFASSANDGYIHYDGEKEALDLTIGGGSPRYMVTSDGYEHSVGNILYYDGTDYTDLAIGSSGQTLTVSGGIPSWQNSISASRWTQIDAADFTAQPVSTSLIAMSNYDVYANIRIGMPIMWIAKGSVNAIGIVGDTGGIISAEALTGISSNNIARDGGLYILCTEVADPNYYLEFFSSPQMDSAHRVAYTATFDDSASAARTLIEDNSSGLGGTITNSAGACSDGASFAAIIGWQGIITNTESGNIEIAGPPLITGTDTIAELWYGTPEMVRRERWIIGSPFGSTTDTLLTDKDVGSFITEQETIRILKFRAYTNTVGGTKARVNLMNGSLPVSTSNGDDGLQLDAADTWYETGVDISRSTTVFGTGTGVEFACKQGDTGTASSATLEFLYIVI